MYLFPLLSGDLLSGGRIMVQGRPVLGFCSSTSCHHEAATCSNVAQMLPYCHHFYQANSFALTQRGFCQGICKIENQREDIQTIPRQPQDNLKTNDIIGNLGDKNRSKRNKVMAKKTKQNKQTGLSLKRLLQKYVSLNRVFHKYVSMKRV